MFGCDAVIWNACHLEFLFICKRNETKETNKRKTNVFLSVLCVAAKIGSQLRFVSLLFDRCMCFVKWVAEGF